MLEFGAGFDPHAERPQDGCLTQPAVRTGSLAERNFASDGIWRSGVAAAAVRGHNRKKAGTVIYLIASRILATTALPGAVHGEISSKCPAFSSAINSTSSPFALARVWYRSPIAGGTMPSKTP